MSETQRLEQRLKAIERQLETTKRISGIEIATFVFEGPLVTNSRMVPPGVLWEEETDRSAWPTMTQVMEMFGFTAAYQRNIEMMQACVDARAPEFTSEYPVRLPDGSVAWMMARGLFYYDESGKPMTLDSVQIDITARKLAEDKLRTFAESVDTALRGSDTMLWGVEIDGTTNPPQTTNDLWVVSGMQKPPTDRDQGVSPEYRERMHEAIDACIRGGNDEYQIEYRTDTNPPRWRYTCARTIRDEEGKPLRIVGTSIDVTALRAAEREKQRMADLLVLACKLSGIAISYFDFVGGAIAGAKATMINVWEANGFDPKAEPDDALEVLGRLVVPEDQAAVRQALDACMSGEAPFFQSEHRIRKADGSIRWDATRGIITRDAGGAPLQFIVAAFDITAVKNAEEEARRNKERLELSILGSKTGTWDIELPDGTLARASVSYTNVFQLLGYSADEGSNPLAHAIEVVIPPEALHAFVAEMQGVLDGSMREWERVYSVRSKDGSARWLLSRGVIQRDPSTGRARRFTGISIDITERMQIEEALRESEQKFRAMYENAVLGFSITSEEGILLDCNDMLCNALGLTRDELVGHRGPTVLTADEIPAAKERLRQLIAGEARQQSYDKRFKHKDGRDVWLNLTFSVMSRDPTLVLGVYQDITHRIGLEEDLRRTKERLELGVRSSGTTIFDIDLPGAPPDYTPRAKLTLIGRENLGYDVATSVADSDGINALLQHPEALALAFDRVRVRDAIQAYLRGDVPKMEIEARTRNADGSVAWHLCRGQALRDSGRPVRLIGSLVDITELKRIEAELETAREAAEEANRAKDEFLANVSHEIRTPMNAILGMTELALDASETAHQRQLLSTVKVAARNLLHVINDLLDFSKITAGKLALDHADFSLRAAIGDVLRALAVRAHKKDLELVCNVNPDVPDLYYGDAGRVRQVLMNLVGNAIKFTPKGEVVVQVMIDRDARTAGDDAIPLRVTVRDTGIGIASEKHAAIFRAFEQEDASTTRRFGGTGLGLTISSQLAALMGGRITVESEPGKGSTFSFTARINRSSKPEWPGTASPGPLEGIEVLVVDDNETNRRILIDWLGRWRMRPTAAADAAAAFEALERAEEAGLPIPLVLLDGRMPDIDGITLAGQIRERFGASAHRLILLSSDHSPALARRSRDAGIHAYLLKPVQQAELLETIWTVMTGSGNLERDLNTNAGAELATRPGALSILVAEDNELNVALLRELLGRRNHRVEVVGDGRSAFERAIKTNASYDVMLLDLHMPEMDGFEVVRAIREHERETGKRLPIIALTARSSSRDREKARAAGMDDFLSKPTDVGALWTAIDRVTADAEATLHRLPLLDPGIIQQTCGGRQAVLERLLEVFRRSVPEHLASTRAALEQRDFPGMRARAHMLAGTLSAFSTIAGALASTLEDAAAEEDLERCTWLLGQVESVSAKLMEQTRNLTLESLGV